MAKYVIIGGVAGGATAAARLRRLAEEADIIVFEKGEHISYANCGLPYYLGGIIPDRERLFVQTPASFGGRFRIDVRVKNEVMRIDPAKQVVHALHRFAVNQLIKQRRQCQRHQRQRRVNVDIALGRRDGKKHDNQGYPGQGQPESRLTAGSPPPVWQGKQS
jgi:flavin-dependent dehydrogenase